MGHDTDRANRDEDRPRKMTSDRTAVREAVLRRAGGRCERCRQELGERHHFHFEWYPVFHADNLIVLCTPCHREMLAKRRAR